MKKVKVFHYDSFSNKPNMGNPAGLVIDAEGLTDDKMQLIAKKVGFNETSFVLPSNVADVRIRYFTPGHEMNLCGHATVGTIYALHERGLLKGKRDLTIETKAGVLPVHINVDENGESFVRMRQVAPKFQKFDGSIEDLVHSIGLHEKDLDETLPIMYGSTGIWTLLVPIKTLDACQRMIPNTEKFPSILKEIPTASIHPLCLETYDEKAHMHGRHFSSPYSGTIEDPVTGTASGVMGAYYAEFLRQDFDSEMTFLIEQGQEMNKDGRIAVYVKRDKKDDSLQIEISGTAVYVKEFQISI
ncbi:PhzF family phenazine biosynthesis protein [Bacillus sp. XF8]|uniref:PhzF family phenazine biosynthesis protein n=1 Tax=Bacillus sp. XF8 TaxID=2819289 RepID=UPI001AA01B85|nr:PhzF family phenazine biosynthesis isomerase [Bacillus sp. XF8]MBO1581492.1 PhzF family phenazine biosynthesis isomerase [Bacillus sp. XF8]